MCERQMDDRLMGECLEYFRERPVFGRLLRGFREKYLSYGKFAGTVTLKNLKESERDDLEGFLLRNYHGKRSASVSAERFERAMAESRFRGITGKDILELYFQEAVESKKEQQQRNERHWKNLLERAKKGTGPLAVRWIEEMEGEGTEDGGSEKTASHGFSSYVKKRDREGGEDFTEARRLLTLGACILDFLPAERGNSALYLAVFAAQVTGNPHALDDGTKDGKFLEMLVKWYVKKTGGAREKGGKSGEFPLMGKQRLYLKAGILRDDVSNYALAAGIRAQNRRGELHAGMEGFLEEGETVQIPLSVIAGWKSAFCPGNRLYIVENPSVYALICGKWDKSCGLMCMNGQPRFSSLLLLDLLSKSGTEVWYAGDFDPEGLLIAQRLKNYYPGVFHYWHMSLEDYEKCVSGEALSPRRIKMLEKIEDPKLTETAVAVKIHGKAGYQENMADAYLEIFQGYSK